MVRLDSYWIRKALSVRNLLNAHPIPVPIFYPYRIEIESIGRDPLTADKREKNRQYTIVYMVSFLDLSPIMILIYTNTLNKTLDK